MEKMRMDEIIAKNWSNAKNMLWYEGEWWTGERVLALVEENVKQLKAAGFGPGDRVVAMLPNSPAFQALCIAVWKLHGAVATLNALAGPQAIAAQVQHTMPAVVVAAPAMKAHAGAFAALPMPFVFLENTGSLPEF